MNRRELLQTSLLLPLILCREPTNKSIIGTIKPSSETSYCPIHFAHIDLSPWGIKKTLRNFPFPIKLLSYINPSVFETVFSSVGSKKYNSDPYTPIYRQDETIHELIIPFMNEEHIKFTSYKKEWSIQEHTDKVLSATDWIHNLCMEINGKLVRYLVPSKTIMVGFLEKNKTYVIILRDCILEQK